VTDSERLERIARVLEEIRDGQREALALQREHAQKTQALQARAEALQDRSARLIVVILIIYVSWLLFRFARW
jgi:chromosome segregation ATPase